ncbi:MAG: glycerol-3-phosphate 1-O-acyltransferase PlsB [Pseudomonadales bacterium]
MLLGRIASSWIRPAVLPDTPHTLFESVDSPCYVLENSGLADRLALHITCKKLNLPLPGSHSATRIEGPISIRRGQGFLVRRSHHEVERLQTMVEHARKTSDNIILIPVAVYWGRSPDKERSFLKLMFSENWTIAGRTRKFFTTLLHGRHTLVQFSEPLSLSDLLQEGQDAARTSRKLSRILRVHFRQRRIATLGPDQSHKRTIINQVLRNSAVKRAIQTEDESKAEPGKHQNTAVVMARQYAYEIAADISYPTVRVLQKLLAALWNKLYDGVRFEGLERLRGIANGKEIVYVPCHRSHIDYLLLSYALYMQGFSLPHIAAGLNLNMPVLGSILRRGGAFFLRRSFAGNQLYAAVFNAYLQEMLLRGHALEYFIEGGRSRSGRLLQPKTGMLSMTVHGYLREPRSPVIFVPIYFGYERLVEGQSFINELSGNKKKKESLFGLLKSVGALRQEFGEVYANIGAPLELDSILQRYIPDWQSEEIGEERPTWLTPIIDELGTEIMLRINRAATVTPISLLALALLSTPHQNMARIDLVRQLELYLMLLQRLQYSDEVVVTDRSAEEIILRGEQLGYIFIEAHALGEIVQINPGQAVAMTYFRNSILHLFAVPASVACCFVNRSSLDVGEVKRLASLGYPFLRTELSLRWDSAVVGHEIDRSIGLLEELKLLTRSKEELLTRNSQQDDAVVQLMQLGQAVMPALQRYYMTTILLAKHDSGSLSQAELEHICELCAERLAIMHGLRSPDFFERYLFRDFIQTLKTQGLVTSDDDGSLHYHAGLINVEADAKAVLDEQIRHSIRSITAQA